MRSVGESASSPKLSVEPEKGRGSSHGCPSVAVEADAASPRASRHGDGNPSDGGHAIRGTKQATGGHAGASLERALSALRGSFAEDRRRRRAARRASRLSRCMVPLESLLMGHRLPPPALLLAQSGWARDAIDCFCPRCGVTRAPFEDVSRGCAECRLRAMPLQRVVRLGRYAPPLSQWAPAVKSRAWDAMGRALGRELGAQVRDALQGGLVEPVDLVVPVPSHWLRCLARGIRHTEVLSEEIANELGVPMRRALRVALARRQARSSRGARTRNRERFEPRRGLFGNAPPLGQRSILLVDDVMTTGGTLGEAAKVLRSLGATRVQAAVCAVADPPHRNALHARGVPDEGFRVPRPRRGAGGDRGPCPADRSIS